MKYVHVHKKHLPTFYKINIKYGTMTNSTIERHRLVS